MAFPQWTSISSISRTFGKNDVPTANLLLTLFSVALICVGQVLFKVVGIRLQQGGHWMDLRIGLIAGIALGIYAFATLLWIHVLRTTPLSKAYPYMALSFVVVPIASVLIFSEQVRPQYLIGSTLIVLGVVVTHLSSNSG